MSYNPNIETYNFRGVPQSKRFFGRDNRNFRIGCRHLGVCRINVEFILSLPKGKKERNTEILPTKVTEIVCLESMFHSIFLKWLFLKTQTLCLTRGI